jgi:LacI family transcriptional regulator
MRATIRDVAQRAGVSAMTVSRVANGSPDVNAKTRERVERAIAELGYVPNNVARSLSQQTTGTLAVFVPDVANPFFMLILRGVESVARQHGYRVLFCNTESDLARENEYIQDVLAHRIDGLLIAPTSDQSRKHLRLPQQHNVPLVLVDRVVEGFECDAVLGDNVGGAQRLTEHLLAAQHRCIAIIHGSLDISTSRDRLHGYRQALEAAGVPWDSRLAVTASVDVHGGYQAMRHLLQTEARPTAVFAINNLMAVGVVQALREQGLEVPHDMALVCFDDIELASQLFPFLTVMAQPAETFGTVAAQLLLERIAGRVIERPRRVVLMPDLIVRTSSTPTVPSWLNRVHG